VFIRLPLVESVCDWFINREEASPSRISNFEEIGGDVALSTTEASTLTADNLMLSVDNCFCNLTDIPSALLNNTTTNKNKNNKEI
jgi:hypothetical protein